MRVLAIGDIVAEDGREFVYNNLDRIRRHYKIDFCIANFVLSVCSTKVAN